MARRRRPFARDRSLAFEFRLARDLGMPVADLRTRMSHAEFMEWAAFYRWEQQEHDRAMKRAERAARQERKR